MGAYRDPEPEKGQESENGQNSHAIWGLSNSITAYKVTFHRSQDVNSMGSRVKGTLEISVLVLQLCSRSKVILR